MKITVYAFSMAVVLIGCSDSPKVTTPTQQTQVTVRLQPGQPVGTEAGGTIPIIRYRAVDQEGDGVANVKVSWTIIGPMDCYPSCALGGAAVSPAQSTSATDGAMTISVKLGTGNGTYKVIPTSADSNVLKLDTATFTTIAFLQRVQPDSVRSQ